MALTNITYPTTQPMPDFYQTLKDLIDAVNLLDSGTTGQVFQKTGTAFLQGNWATIRGLPTGGATRTALLKNNGTDYNASFLPIYEVPTGGDTDFVLTKNSATDRDASFKQIGTSTSIAINPINSNAGTAYYYKIGKLVTVQLNLSSLASAFDTNNLFGTNFLPLPVEPLAINLNSNVVASFTITMILGTDGSLKPMIGQVGSYNCSGSFSYIEA